MAEILIFWHLTLSWHAQECMSEVTGTDPHLEDHTYVPGPGEREEGERERQMRLV